MAATVLSRLGLDLSAPLPLSAREGISSSVDGGEDSDESDPLIVLWCWSKFYGCCGMYCGGCESGMRVAER